MKSLLEKQIDRLCEDGMPELATMVSDKSVDDQQVKRTLIQYIRSDNTFSPVGEIELVDTLPPFPYKLLMTQSGAAFQKFKAQTDELLKFDNSKMSEVLAEVSKFWTLKSSYNDLGFLHNRGILLYGPPGSGKSSLLQQVTEQMVEQGDVVFYTSCQIGPVINGLKAFRQVEPSRRLVVVLEDLDEYMSYQERDLLQLLDGENSVDNVLYLGTTNYINKLSQRLMRPGRFDKKVLIDFPPIEGRLAYLENKLGKIETPEKIRQIAEMTDKFSFGHLRELIISAYCLGEDLDKTVERLRDMNYTALPERGKIVFESAGKGLKLVEGEGSYPKKCPYCKSSEGFKDVDGAVYCKSCGDEIDPALVSAAKRNARSIGVNIDDLEWVQSIYKYEDPGFAEGLAMKQVKKRVEKVVLSKKWTFASPISFEGERGGLFAIVKLKGVPDSIDDDDLVDILFGT